MGDFKNTAAVNNSTEGTVEILLRDGINIEALDEVYIIGYIITVIIIEMIVPNIIFQYGFTPLLAATSIGRTDIMKLLLDANASIEAVDEVIYFRERKKKKG
jgi:ankyrin repeat protein